MSTAPVLHNADGSSPIADDEPRPRRYLILAIVATALFMSAIDQTIVATALDNIQHDLHATVNWSSWTITTYALAQIMALPLAGRFSDQYGRKTVFVSAVALFTVSSLVCGLADNIYLLVVLRGLQGIGGGAFLPSVTGIVSDYFGRDRDRVIGLFTSIFPIGGLVGPVLGGVFVTYWSWRGIFLINVPLGVALFAAAAFLLPASTSREKRRIDMRGIALLLVGLLGAMTGMSVLGGRHPDLVLMIVSFALALGALIQFVHHARTDPNAVIPLRLLRGNGFATVHLISFSSGAATLGFAGLVALYAQNRYHLTPLSAGTLLSARAVGTITIAGITAFMLRRIGYRRPMAAGFAALGAGLILTALSPPFGLSAYTWLAISSTLAGLGMGLSIPATNNAALHLVPQEAAAMSGVRGMFRQMGGITSITVITAFTARSGTPGHVESIAFLGFGVIVLLLVPLAGRVPDHRGSW